MGHIQANTRIIKDVKQKRQEEDFGVDVDVGVDIGLDLD